MALMTQGRVCRIARGRDAGKACIILTKTQENKVKIVGPQITAKMVNVLHLEPTADVVAAAENTSQDESRQLIENL